MKSVIISSVLTVSAVALGLPLTAAAYGPGMADCDGSGPKAFAGVGDPASRVQARLERFKQQLNLSVEQQTAWQAFADKVASEAGQARTAMLSLRQDQTLTAPERMARMQTLMQERLQAMAGVHEVFNNLYNLLSAEQKKIADAYAQAWPHGAGLGSPTKPAGGPANAPGSGPGYGRGR